MLIENKKARFDYEILEKYDAGLELLGTEVKSIRSKRGSLDGAHITVRGNEAYIIGMFIPPIQEKNAPKDFDPYRNRRLLMTKSEIMALGGHESKKGLTIIPLSLYNSKRLIKLSIALAKGKKAPDKRESIKKREVDRTTRREYTYR